MEYYVHLNDRLRNLHDLFFRTVPEFINAVFAKTRPKRSFSIIENERFGLFAKTGLNSGTGVFVYGLVGRSLLFSENFKQFCGAGAEEPKLNYFLEPEPKL
jgi:hypothetical protein